MGIGGFFWAFIVYFLLSYTVIIGCAYAALHYLSADLPDHQQLETKIVNQTLSTTIYSADRVVLRTVSEEKGKRFWVPYRDIPATMIDAVVATEDSRFFSHWGVSLPDIARAMTVNLFATRFHFSKKFPYFFDFEIEEGASTITQQLARDIFLTRETSYIRKLKEQIVSLRIEHTYTKSEILEFFLNRMFFGNRSYGIQAAARGYFGKDAKYLNLNESAVLAGILQGPSRLDPRRSDKRRDLCRQRRNVVLAMMVNAGKINRAEALEEQEKPLELAVTTDSNFGKAPYYVQFVLEDMYNRYGDDMVDTAGLSIFTTLDSRLQDIAEKALDRQLEVIQTKYADKQVRYRRPPGLSDARAARDSLQKTQVQGALVAIDVRTGAILAMVGGRDFDYFNRATQALRQPGSSFKPFVYTTALDNGWRTCDVINDAYVKYQNPDGTFWEPQNFDMEFKGPMTLRDAIKESRNVVAIKLMNDTENRGVGARTVIEYARKMGVNTPMQPVPSLAIGTAQVRLLDMVAAYTIFPNQGIKTETFAVDKVFDKKKTMIYRQPNDEGGKRQVLRPETASLMLTMLESVAKEGTASGVISRKGMADRPCAGKTGTGNEYKDAWFIGFTPYIACGIWVGFDSEETTLGNKVYGTGATAALPVWVDFMMEASDVLGYGKDRFTYAPIVQQRICRDSYKAASVHCPESSTYLEYFLPGTEISDICPVHGHQDMKPRNDRFMTTRPDKRRGY